MAVARAYHPRSLVAFFPWIFPRCRASKKATGSESWPRKIHRNHRHWRSRSVLTPPIEEPGTRENRARVRSLSLPGFSRLSRSYFLSLYTVTASTTSSSSPSSSSACSRPAPPRTALFLSRFYLGFPSPTRRRHRRRRRRRRRARSRSSPSFSTFTLPSLLFCSPPAAFLPLLRCRFRRSPRRAPIIPVCASSETVSSSLLFFSLVPPSCHLLP